MHKTGPASSLDSLPEEDRFRADALELFLSGAVSAERASRLCGFAQAAGASGVQDLARARQGKNTARNLLRRTLRQNVWPPPYECQVRGLNQRTGKEESYSLAVMLPHEVLHAIMRANSAENIRKEQAKIPSLQEQLQAEDEDVLLVALWLDGVPFNSDRSQTLQCLTLSVPGLSDQADFRFPVTGFPKHFQMPACTWDDLMTITAWSLQCLYTGHFPKLRHDGTEFKQQDTWRTQRALRPLGCRALLGEVRADWAAYKEVLRLPGWSGHGPICWFCDATLQNLEEVDSEAQWRTVLCVFGLGSRV